MIPDVAYQLILIVLQLVILFLAIGYILWSVTRRISGYSDVPLVSTPRKMLPQIADALQIASTSVVYDLGCGDGRFLFYCAQRFPNARFIGIEKNLLLILYLNMKRRITGVNNVSFRHENIFETDFSDATHIYAFLLPHLIDRLFSSTKEISGARLASRAYPITNRIPEQVVELAKETGTWNENRLYVYKL